MSGAVDLSVTPLDVGFDVRLHSIAVSVPASTRSAAYDHGGETRTVCGTLDEIIAALTAAGYDCLVTDERTP